MHGHTCGKVAQNQFPGLSGKKPFQRTKMWKYLAWSPCVLFPQKFRSFSKFVDVWPTDWRKNKPFGKMLTWKMEIQTSIIEIPKLAVRKEGEKNQNCSENWRGKTSKPRSKIRHLKYKIQDQKSEIQIQHGGSWYLYTGSKISALRNCDE